ncbi:MAG: hypothetical protein ACYSU4_08390 [Planctomycetota bacterium]|jgi:hypothetical protein
METKEKTSNESKHCRTMKGKQNMAEMMEKCCEGMNESGDCGSKMAECMKRCKWFPLMPVIFGVALLLMGYYLDAEITRILWMIAAGFVILMGTFGLAMISRMKGMCCGPK